MATMTENDDQCVICFTPLSKTLSISTECNHRFHIECIRKNIENGNERCPLCLQSLAALVSHFGKDGQERIRVTEATGKNDKVPRKTKATKLGLNTLPSFFSF
jgi:hypothetical protein